MKCARQKKPLSQGQGPSLVIWREIRRPASAILFWIILITTDKSTTIMLQEYMLGTVLKTLQNIPEEDVTGRMIY